MTEEEVLVLRTEEIRQMAIDRINAVEIDPDSEKEDWTQVKFSKHKRNRSRAQHNLYHLWVGEISEAIFQATGVRKTKEEIKAFLQLMFLGETEVDMPGRTFHVIVSTTSLSVGQMAEFMQQVEAYAVDDLDTPLSRPEDRYYLELMGKQK